MSDEMFLKLLIKNLLDEIKTIILLVMISFTIGFLVGQTYYIVGYELIGMLGWIIVGLIALTIIITLLYTICFTIRENNITEESLSRAITLWMLEQEGRIEIKKEY